MDIYKDVCCLTLILASDQLKCKGYVKWWHEALIRGTGMQKEGNGIPCFWVIAPTFNKVSKSKEL